MYTEQSIDDVRQADIVQVVGNFIELKRAGKNYMAKSPFSNDKTASFCVTPSLNIFKCFSSGIGGDGIKFIMKLKNVGFYEAIKIVAEVCNITLIQAEVSEEEKRKRDYKDELFGLTESVASQYQNELHNLPNDHWAKQMMTRRNVSAEIATKFGIGYAPNNYQFLTNPLIEKGKFEIAKTVGLINSKESRSYDFFVDRLIFPIHNQKGNIVGYGGRKSDEAEGPKYINSKETEIFHKSKVLYGLYQCLSQIALSRTAILVEGYTDVIGLFQGGCELAVANCGTAPLSATQCNILHKYAQHVIVCRDNDGLDDKGNEQKGMKAAMRDINTLLNEGFKVSVVVLPEGEDPDSFARKTENVKDWIFENIQDAVIWKSEKLKTKAANDPDAISEMVDEVAEMLYSIKDDVKRNSYLDQVRKLIKQPVKVLKDKIDIIHRKNEIKAEEKGKVEANLANDLGLPDGADFQEFLQNRYVTVGNACFFRGREGFFKGTNFKITPLFHVYGKQDNRRLCEVINELGMKKLIDFESEDFIQASRFKTRLINEGFFIFHESATPTHFALMTNHILSTFIMAFELKTLGWQKEGFFAYANYVYHQGVLKEVNNYGIVQLETEVQTESEYMEKVKHYYSPAFSEMYKHSRDDDDPYENDRYFVYKQSPVTFATWMKQLHKVYGKKAITGIAFLVATMFRDLFLSRYQFFPHLFLTGEKGSGKSKFGESLVAIFTFKQEPFDLNSGTPVAFYRRLSRTVNAPTMLEEYHDNVDDRIFQPIKGAYDGRGREMGKATGDNRTTTTKVHCSLILLSQYLSSRDDNSLTSRSIIEHFIKPQDSYTTEQIEDYALLKSWEEVGMSSMLIDILEHRKLIEKTLHKEYADLSKQLKAELKAREYQERMLQNYLALLAPMKILFPFFQFPFTFEDMYNQFKEAILDSSDLIIESEGLAEFWRTLEYLRDRQPFALLEEGLHFQIDKFDALKLQTRKGEKDFEFVNTDRKEIMMLRLNLVHQLYHKEVSSREGVEVIGENTLRNYFKSKKYFIGSVKSHRFKDTSTSAYAFDYRMMEEGGVLNLKRRSKEEQTLHDKDDQDDLPY